ncbi:hypothetical protein GE21DRAFT_1094626 [Neurospora crassa]|nr:hypothetical protein GE21DRAFT_1094626 [Neurospora crassa]
MLSYRAQEKTDRHPKGLAQYPPVILLLPYFWAISLMPIHPISSVDPLLIDKPTLRLFAVSFRFLQLHLASSSS